VKIDFAASREELRKIINKELLSAITVADEAQKREPNNAFYGYIKAHLYFELGEKDMALKEIRDAASQDYLNMYFTEMRRATGKVLAEVSFPDEMRSYIVDLYEPFGDFIRGEIWEKQLVPLAKEYQEKGEAQHVQDISKVVLGITKQIREEPMPYESFFNHSFSQGLEEWVLKHNGSDSANTTQRSDEELSEFTSSATKYVLLTGICAVLLIGGIALRKKSRSGSDK